MAQTAANETKDEAGSRFLEALQRVAGLTDMSEASVTAAIAKLTPEQRQQLQAEADEAKRELFEKEEKKEDREVYLKTMSQQAEQAGMPGTADVEFMSKKISAFMQTSSEQPPPMLLLEAVAASPYLLKDALAELRDADAPKVAATELDAIEAALSAIGASGWAKPKAPPKNGSKNGANGAGNNAGNNAATGVASAGAAARPPVVRRTLLLLCLHLYQEQIPGGLEQREPSTAQAAIGAVIKARRLLDATLSAALQRGWVKAVLAGTELQAMLSIGVWSHEEDECREVCRRKLVAFGLKPPRLTLRCSAPDVRPGRPVPVKVTVTRGHAHTADEMAAAAAAEQSATNGTNDGADKPQQQVKRENWWLIAESVKSKGSSKYPSDAPILHNHLVAYQPLSAPLNVTTMEAELDVESPGTPGDYTVIVHVRSCGMVGVDVKRKITFTVKPERPPSKASLANTASQLAEFNKELPGFGSQIGGLDDPNKFGSEIPQF
uniref:SEC63 domain-containing protein n=1 Tax=Chrysotila carterae TaxID=13221 RepID=A0A7S4BNB3_CHRCT